MYINLLVVVTPCLLIFKLGSKAFSVIIIMVTSEITTLINGYYSAS